MKGSEMTGAKLLCQRHPLFYFLSVWEKRIRRTISWYFGDKNYSKNYLKEKLPYRLKKHQSKLIKQLGDSDMVLQYNKVKNLSLAIEKINGILIYPGETFSFCKTVGLPTKKKGYLMGMELSRGEARAGTGGGICQISNLICWLALHSPLTIIERHHHSFDPFPDDGRVLPFASGATVFYNYRDFQITNNTPYHYQINLWLSEHLLEGELRINEALDYNFHVYEKEHKFLERNGKYFRSNEIWRDKCLKFKSGKILSSELIFTNYAEVKYKPSLPV